MRLRPYTTVIPKPLVPVGDRPVLEHIIRSLARCGVNQVDLCVSHLGQLISVYLANADLPPEVELNFHWESEPLGTAGALAMVPDLDGTFIVMNGDVLTTLDYRKLLEIHREKDAALTVAMHNNDVHIDLGVIESRGRPGLQLHREAHAALPGRRGHLRLRRAGAPVSPRRPVPVSGSRHATAGGGRARRRMPVRCRLVRHRHTQRVRACGRRRGAVPGQVRHGATAGSRRTRPRPRMCRRRRRAPERRRGRQSHPEPTLDRPPRRRGDAVRRAVKRTFDVVVAALALVVLLAGDRCSSRC